MQANIKTQNKKELQLQILVDSGYIYTGINKQLVKEEEIQDRTYRLIIQDFQY